MAQDMDSADERGDEIEITPEMIQAGMFALLDYGAGDYLMPCSDSTVEELVIAVVSATLSPPSGSVRIASPIRRTHR